MSNVNGESRSNQRASKRRRGNGEGSIYQRADGRWAATITIGYDAKGKRRRRVVYGKTKKECQEKLTKLQASKLDGTLVEPTKMTVAAYLERWLDDAVKPSVRHTTWRLYKLLVEKHICSHIGAVMLTKLTPLHVQGLYSSMAAAKASARMRQLAHAVLRRALNQALKWGLVARNVCDAVERPRAPKRDILALTDTQVGQLLKSASGDRLGALYVLAVATGMRQGELFGLQWSDIDLDQRKLQVRHGLIDVDGRLELAEPKTAKARRQIDLPDFAVQALRNHKALLVAEGHDDVTLVFCDSSGGPLRKSNVIRKSFKPLLKRAGLPNMRFHDLRHTSATLLLSEGTHPKVVQERLGHSSIALTLDTYSHVLPTMGREAVDRLGTAIQAVTS